MANPEHVEILKQGVEAWNKWRGLHEDVRPDFNGADLSGGSFVGADLTDADFRGADLDGADLGFTNLSRADLSDARLSRALLIRADLSDARLSYARLYSAILTDARLIGTNLGGADLSSANLIGANLRGAGLIETNLDGANLTASYLGDADFTGTVLGYTTFADNDLSQVKGLEAAKHSRPSVISIDAIYKSQGKIPEVFLRGCGVPESFIVQMRALIATTEAIQFYSCFISYSSKDQDFANRLHADLQSKGVRCWFAPEDIKIGDRFRVKIDESIRLYDKLLLVLSENSVSSSWVEKEVETAMEREREDAQHRTVLFPVRLDDAVMEIHTGWPADVRRTRHVGDFTGWKGLDSYEKAFDRLLRDLKAEEGQAAEG